MSFSQSDYTNNDDADGDDEDAEYMLALQISAEQASADWLVLQQEQDELERQLQNSLQHEVQRQIQESDASMASDLVFSEALHQSSQQEALRKALVVREERTERHAGSWDCPVCTLWNEPYAASCKACQKAAPSHVLVFADIPNTRFGVELELIVTNGIQDGYSCQWIAEELTRRGIPTTFQGYTHAASTTHWKVVTDSSLRSSRRDLCCELVSPILHGNDGICAIRVLLETIRSVGIAINSSCGFHVHVDAESMTLRNLQSICKCFCAVERAFDCVVARDEESQAKNRCSNRNEYCRSNRLAFGTNSNKRRWSRIEGTRSTSELVELLNPDSDRYRKLNLTNLTSRRSGGKTVEFRQHGGVRELLAAEAWVRLLLRFCENSKQNPIPCLLPQQSNEADEIRALFDLVDCAGLESFYMLDRRLFPVASHPRPSATLRWKCDQCSRKFRNSQSLAQHGRDTGHSIQY